MLGTLQGADSLAGHRSPVLVLQALYDPMDELEKLEAVSGTRGCVYCGGLGHRIANCPKLAQNTRDSTRMNKDYFGKGGFGGEV